MLPLFSMAQNKQAEGWKDNSCDAGIERASAFMATSSYDKASS